MNDGKLDVGYIGHLYEGRGVELLVDLARRCGWLHMHIVGGDPDNTALWQESCREIENVTFYGHVPLAETEGYRQRCDVLAAPYQEVVKVAGDRVDTSRWMSPLKIFEYMASRKAIVCSDLPVLREILRDGENALLCKPDDVGAWGLAMEKLRDDADLRTRLADNAFTEYRKHYTWEKRAEKLLQEFAQDEA